MANIVLMPQLGISEDSAILTKWHVKTGDSVKVGDLLFSIETGKSTFDVESEYGGIVLALTAEEGDEVTVKAPVCAIGEQGEDISEFLKAPVAETETAESAAAETPEAAVEKVSVAVSNAAVTSGTVRGISPRARKLAEKNDIDPAAAVPTGPEGRIIERDVRMLLENPEIKAGESKTVTPVRTEAAPAAEFEDKPLSNMRKVIAKNMLLSLQNTAQLTHTASFDASNIMDYRKLLKNTPDMSGVTLTDMILYAVTRTLPDFPILNAWLTGDTVRYFKEVNLACAVDTEKGLMVPVIFNASRKTLFEISKELKTLAGACREGTVGADLLSGGSFTVSNLGQYGIESFTPILNPPQTGILGVNTITRRLREEGASYPCMTLSLTYDHRALDGAPASKFLQTLCKNLESFTALLAR